METVQLIRDISIIAFVFASFICMTLIGVMALKVYRKVSAVLEDAQITAKNAAAVTSALASATSGPALTILAALGTAGGAAFAAFRRKQKEQKQANEG
jgi:hypothetical protein